MMRGVVAGIVVSALVVCGCSGGAHQLDLRGTSGPRIVSAADLTMPSAVLGLTVKPEDVAKTVALAQRAYIDSLVLYGLRSDNLLQATFQISRFNPGTKYSTPSFQLEIADQVGSQVPIQTTVAGQTVYVTAGNRQRLAVWFRGPYLFVLATRQGYPAPRALLRRLLAVGA